jgi:hypothetical protein
VKFTLVIHQARVADAGLVGKVTADDLCLLCYLFGWFTYAKSKVQLLGERKFVWLHFERAVEELPLLFNPGARMPSRRNQLCCKLDRLRTLGLVETTKGGRRLFFRLTDLGLKLTRRDERRSLSIAKSLAIITKLHDDTVTSEQDGTVTPLRDEYLSTYIDETVTKETERKESPPRSPLPGEAESVILFWNSFPELPGVKTSTPNRARKILKRLGDPFWREHWRECIQRFSQSDYLKGGGQNGWRANFDWFLEGDSLAKIMEGAYDNRPQKPNSAFGMIVLQGQARALKTRIDQHPANEDGRGKVDLGAPQDMQIQLRKLKTEFNKVTRQLSGVP